MEGKEASLCLKSESDCAVSASWERLSQSIARLLKAENLSMALEVLGMSLYS